MRLATLALLAVALAAPAAAQPAAVPSAAGLVETVLNPGAPDLNDLFGASVALSGAQALVSAAGADAGAADAGRAVLYLRDGGAWTADVTFSPGAAGDFFGVAVALQGDRALVTAIGTDGGRGAAYVFERSAGGWTQQAVLQPDAVTAGDGYGAAVALDGDRVLVGAPFAADNTGAVYVYARDAAGWAVEAVLAAPDGAPGDRFGRSVALDGDRALVGAPGTDALAGSAYVFRRDGGAWPLDARLDGSDRRDGDRFGSSVSLSGARALLGAQRANRAGPASGAAYVFALGGAGWTEEARLLPAGLAEQDRFGYAVALDGGLALVGSFHRDTPETDRGAAIFFAFDGTAWTERETLAAAAGAAGDGFGYAVALDGGLALVGAPQLDVGGGTASVFEGVAVGAEATPAAARLSAPAPNPTAHRARLTLTVEAPQPVRATLHDALGREAAVLFDGVAAGELALVVGTSALAAGVYGVRVVGETFAETRRLTVVR